MRLRDPFPLYASVLALLLVLAWDASGADLLLARLIGTPFGFPLREHWFLVKVMHQGGKTLSWALVLLLLLAVRWPVGALRRLTAAERWQLVLSVLAGVCAVALIKKGSQTSCPWDLRDFGGMAAYVSHWQWGVRDGGGGHCFPAGHASAAFAFLGAWFAWRRAAPRMAVAWLLGALAAGLAFGLAQQLRGAHYLSHTLWSAWVCWTTGLAVDRAMQALARRREAHAGAGVAAAGQQG